MEAETGLHNLLSPAKKAAKIRQFIAEETDAKTKRTYSGDANEALRAVADAFTDASIRYYGPDYNIAVRGMLYSAVHDTQQIVLVPLNLITYILNVGFEIPPANLPDSGIWEGAEHIYTYQAAPNELTMPEMKLEDKLVV